MVRALAIASMLAACSSPHHGGGPDAGDDDSAPDSGGGGGGGDGGGSDCGVLHVVIRDFVGVGCTASGSATPHPDFEAGVGGVVTGIVAPTITPGGDPTPSNPIPADAYVQSAASFAEWYADNPSGVVYSTRIERDLPMTPEGSNSYVFDEEAYFPIDGSGWGDELGPDGQPELGSDGSAHNFHFTTEAHATFTYGGGEVFTFTGDDDVWVYVNGHLAIDLGGVHGAANETIDFDAQAAALGLVPGNSYPIDFFQAERHTTESHFRIETSIACFTNIQ